jgi:hypothetical protein
MPKFKVTCIIDKPAPPLRYDANGKITGVVRRFGEHRPAPYEFFLDGISEQEVRPKAELAAKEKGYKVYFITMFRK